MKKIKKSDRQYNYILLAENFYLDNRKEKARDFYQKALKFEGRVEDEIIILYNIAQISDEIGETIQSLESYKTIIELDNNQEGAYYGMAIMEERLGKYDKAMENYHKAIGLDPSYDRAYYYAANLYDKMGERKKALEYYYKVIELVPDDYIAYNNIGSIYEEKNQDKKAYKMIKKSLSIEAEYDKALFNMGVVERKLGNDNRSLKYYFKVINLNPQFAKAYLNISAIYIEEERFQDTIDLLSEGIGNNPDEEDLYYNRACCHSILGNAEEAVKDLEKALLLSPDIKNYIKADEDFINLHQDPRFINLIKEEEF